MSGQTSQRVEGDNDATKTISLIQADVIMDSTKDDELGQVVADGSLSIPEGPMNLFRTKNS